MPSSPTPAPTERSSDGLGIAGALLAVSVWGVASIIPKELAMGGLAIATYRFAMYAVAATAVLGARGTRIDRRVLRGSLGGGIALGVDVALFFSAVKLTSVANATVIGALQPAVVAIMANRVFGEVIRPRDLALGAVAIAGVAVVVVNGAAEAPTDWRGDLLAVGALFAWSGYFVMSKRAQQHLTTNEYTVGAAIWVAAINAPLALAFGQSLGLPQGEEWLWLAAMAFGAGVLGHTVMNWSLKQIPLWLGSTFTLLVPVVSTTAAWAFLDEPVTAVQAGAIGVVLLSLAGVITGQAGIGSRPRPLRR